MLIVWRDWPAKYSLLQRTSQSRQLFGLKCKLRRRDLPAASGGCDLDLGSFGNQAAGLWIEQLETAELHQISLGIVDALQLGDEVQAIGQFALPFGLGSMSAASERPNQGPAADGDR